MQLTLSPKPSLARFQSLIALFVLCLGISLLSNKFLTVNNLWNVLRQISVNVCISTGMTLVVLTAGIDLSVGSVLALAGAITAGLFRNGIPLENADLFIGFTLLGAMLAGLLTGSALGWFNGWAITRFNLPPFVATLAMLTIARGLTMLWTGGFPITGLGDSFTYLGTGWLLGIPVPVWMSVVVASAVFLTDKTRLGRYIYAIGGSESAARLSGVNVEGVKRTVSLPGRWWPWGACWSRRGSTRPNRTRARATNSTPSRLSLSAAPRCRAGVGVCWVRCKGPSSSVY